MLVNKETVQELIIAVHNTSSEEITITADALNSYSASTGIISYQRKKTAEYYGGKSFTSFVSNPIQEVRLKSGEERKVIFTLDLKETVFDGEILGAFCSKKSNLRKLLTKLMQVWNQTISCS